MRFSLVLICLFGVGCAEDSKPDNAQDITFEQLERFFQLCKINADGIKLSGIPPSSIAMMVDSLRAINANIPISVLNKKDVDSASSNTLPWYCTCDNQAIVVVSAIDDSASERRVFVVQPNGSAKWQSVSMFISTIREDYLMSYGAISREGFLWSPTGDLNVGKLTGGRDTRVITLINGGDEPLEIESHRFNCGCIVGTLKSTTILPHSATELNLIINSADTKTTRFSVDWLAKMVTAKGEEYCRFKVVGDVIQPVSVNPKFFQLGNVAPNEAIRSLSIELTGEGIESMDIFPVAMDPGIRWIDARIEKHKQVITLHVEKGELLTDDNSMFFSKLVLAVKEKQQHLVEIGISGRIMPWIRVTPSVVNLGRVQPGEKVNREIHVDSISKSPLSFYAGQPDYLEAASSGEQDIEITFTAPSGPKIFRTQLLVVVDGRGVEVPVVGELLDNTISSQ